MKGDSFMSKDNVNEKIFEFPDEDKKSYVGKRTLLPSNYQKLLEDGDINILKKIYDSCEIYARYKRYSTNSIGVYPLPREFAFWLVEQGIDLEFLDEERKTPIFHHLNKEKSGVPLLFELGANIHHKMINDYNIIHKAVEFEDREAVELAVREGVDINALTTANDNDMEIYTPLEYYLNLHLKSKELPEKCVDFAIFLNSNGAKTTEKSCEYIWEMIEEYEECIEDGEITKLAYRSNNKALDILMKSLKVRRQKEDDYECYKVLDFSKFEKK